MWSATRIGTPKGTEEYNALLKDAESKSYYYYSYCAFSADPMMETEYQQEPEITGEMIKLWELEKYDALPWPGGTQNQPHVLMEIFAVIINARKTVEKIVKQRMANERSMALLARE